MQQRASQPRRAVTADEHLAGVAARGPSAPGGQLPGARRAVDQPITAGAHSAQAPRIPPIPHDPAAADCGWAGRWPRRSYLELAALDTAPGCARDHARAVLWEWGLGAAGDEAALVVSEIVTNAVLSTRAHRHPAPVLMWMLSDRARVLFLVWDATMPAPVLGDATPEAEHGRGLTIVEALSSCWGWYRLGDERPGGKVVWALIQTLLQPMQHSAVAGKGLNSPDV